MTLSATAIRNSYVGNGSTTAFPYTFKVFAAADLRVYLGTTLQTITTHYTVSGVGADAGGTVTFVTAPPDDTAVVILRSLSLSQGINLVENDPFPAETVEGTGLDRLVMLVQQVNDKVDRAPLIGEFSCNTGVTLPEPSAGKFLRWPTTGNALENAAPASTTISSPVPIADGGTAGTTALAARQNLNIDGQLRKVLTNRTGVGLVTGDVVAFSTANDDAVVLGDTVSSKAQLAVALGTIADTATGEFLLAGVVTLNVTGAVTRGRYLRKSGTTKVAEDSGTLMGAATDPPQGAFAVALEANSGATVVANMFGQTYPGSTAPVISGIAAIKGARSVNNATTPISQCDIAADQVEMRDPTGCSTSVAIAPSKTVNLLTAGPAANGRDQAGAFGASSWLRFFWIAVSGGTPDGIATTAVPTTGPTLPGGYTLTAYSHTQWFNSSSHLVPGRLRGRWFRYNTKQNVLTLGTAVCETQLDISALVPPEALNVQYSVMVRDTAGGLPILTINGIEDCSFFTVQNTAGLQLNFTTELTVPNVNQELFYTWSSAPSGGVTIDVLGYECPN